MITIYKSGIVKFHSPANILKRISWLGTVLSILGAFLVANSIFLTGYCFFATGAVLWIIVAKIQKNEAMLFLEIVFLIANINGILNNL